MFNDLFRFNEKQQAKVKALTEPLKRCFGMDQFWHNTLHEDGSFSNTCRLHEGFIHFWDKQCYHNTDFFVAPSRLQSGYFLLAGDRDFEKVQDSLNQKYSLNHCHM